MTELGFTLLEDYELFFFNSNKKFEQNPTHNKRDISRKSGTDTQTNTQIKFVWVYSLQTVTKIIIHFIVYTLILSKGFDISFTIFWKDLPTVWFHKWMNGYIDRETETGDNSRECNNNLHALCCVSHYYRSYMVQDFLRWYVDYRLSSFFFSVVFISLQNNIHTGSYVKKVLWLWIQSNSKKQSDDKCYSAMLDLFCIRVIIQIREIYYLHLSLHKKKVQESK